MSTKAFLKPNATLPTDEEKYVFRRGGEAPHVLMIHLDIEDMEQANTDYFAQNMEYLTIKQSFWESSGFSFVPGIYEGEGFHVEISPRANEFRGGKNAVSDYKQNLLARFTTPAIGAAFWAMLRNGDIMPTAPLCRQLSLTESQYAKQASIAVGLSSRLSAQEAMIAQLMNHVQHLGQIIQDRVLTRSA